MGYGSGSGYSSYGGGGGYGGSYLGENYFVLDTLFVDGNDESNFDFGYFNSQFGNYGFGGGSYGGGNYGGGGGDEGGGDGGNSGGSPYPGADGFLGNPFGGSGGDRPAGMDGSQWRKKSNTDRTNNQARSVAFNAMFGQGSNPYNQKQSEWVNNFLDNKANLNPNSFEYNTWKGNNGFTYEIPAADINGNTDIESRLKAFYNSFANQGEFNSSARTGTIPAFLGGTLDAESRAGLLRNSAIFPQVINQGSEIISDDGTTVTYPDGTSFATNLDVENFTFQPTGRWEVNSNGEVVDFEFPEGATGKSTYNTEFFNNFVEAQREAYNNGESWESLSIGYLDSEGYDSEGYNSEGYDRNNFDRSGLDRDGYDTQGFKDGYNREGYDSDGLDINGYDSEGFDYEGFDIHGLRRQDIAEGYYVDEDGILVIPEIVVTGNQDDVLDDGQDNSLATDFISIDIPNFGNDNQNQGESGGPGINLDTSSVANDGSFVPTPNPSELFAGEGVFFEKNDEELNEIAGRFGGTRRAYNDFLRSDEGQEAARNLGDFINDNISPSGDFDMTKRAELLDKLALIATDGGFAGLNAFAVGVNLLEGVIGTNLIDVPNVGYLIDNLSEKFLDDDLLADIEKIVPDFVENLTGLGAVLQANETPSGYLAQGFDLSTWLLGDVGMAREVDYGLRPATEQIAQQQEDYLRAFLGDEMYNEFLGTTPVDDPNFFQQAIDLVSETVFGTELEQFLQDIKGQVDEETYNEVKARVDAEPSLFNKLGELASSGFDSLATIGTPIANAFETFGFNQQKYFGGNLPMNLLNMVGLSSLGMPIGSMAEFLGGAMAPSGQELSDYLYSKGIDPTTATRRDIGMFLNDEGYDVPNFDPQTGEFIIPTTADGNEFNIDTDGDGFVDNFASNLADFAGDDTLLGRLINGEVTLTDGLLEIGSGIIDEGTDVIKGVTLDGVDGGGDANVFGDGTQNEGLPFDDQVFLDTHNQADPNALVQDESGGADDTTGPDNSVDSGGNMDNGNMDNQNYDSSGYDAAYETAKFLLGAEQAERFRGLGLYNSELQDIIGAYSSDVSQRELQRLIELNRGEQTGINELRDIQKQSDLDLLGDYGQEYADAVRGLDPTALGILGQQEELSDRLYRRAAGDLTAEEEADAEERAFEIAASTGRTMDSTRIANVLRAEEDMVANLEGRAQQAGTSTYNMSRGLTGNIPAMLLGNNGNPYGTGVGQVTPPLGIGDVVSMGTQQYAQQQNIAQAQRQLDIVNQQYDAAIAANEPSKAQQFFSEANEIMGYISVAQQGLEFLGNAPKHVADFKRNVSNAWTGLTTMWSGGSGKANYNYNPNSAFNVNSYNYNTNDYLDLGSIDFTYDSRSNPSSYQYNFGNFGD